MCVCVCVCVSVCVCVIKSWGPHGILLQFFQLYMPIGFHAY